jgi:hypothetical protein
MVEKLKSTKNLEKNERGPFSVAVMVLEGKEVRDESNPAITR